MSKPLFQLPKEDILQKRIDECMRLIDTLPSEKQFKRAVRQRDQLGKALHLIIEHCHEAGATLLNVETIARNTLEITGHSQRGEPRYIKLKPHEPRSRREVP